MDPADPTLRKARAVLEELYGERLKGVVLYGSCARGTETEESDIDLLVLLEGPVEVGKEIFRICHELLQVELDTGRLISPMPADVEEYQGGTCRLYRHVVREGVAV